MTTLAAGLEAAGWRLHSGGADGADTAFENGTTTRRRTIYLPWKGYNGHAGPDAVTLSPQQQAEVQPKVAKYHGAWGRCSRGARALHGRNFAIIHGLTDQGADRTVDAVICWTPDGRTQGGHGHRDEDGASSRNTGDQPGAHDRWRRAGDPGRNRAQESALVLSTCARRLAAADGHSRSSFPLRLGHPLRTKREGAGAIDTDLLTLGDRRIHEPQRLAVSRNGMVATAHHGAAVSGLGGRTMLLARRRRPAA